MRYREYMVDGDTDGILLILQNKMRKLICLRQDFYPVLPFVAGPPLRRNISKKIHCKSLEPAENRLTFALAKTGCTAFASSKVEVRIKFYIAYEFHYFC